MIENKIKNKTFAVYIKHDKNGNYFNDVRNNLLRTLFNSFYLFTEDAQLVLDNRYSPSDVGVFFGLPKVSRSSTLRSTRKQKSLNDVFYSHKRQLVVERGYLRRDVYYSVGWGGINGIADFKNKDMPKDRFEELKIKPKSVKEGKKDGHILFCGQMPFDTNVQEKNKENYSYVDWCRDAILEIKKHTKRDVIFRLHPLLQDKHRGSFLNKISDICIISEKNLEDDFEDAWAVVALNSNSLVDATIRGLPIFALSKGSVAYEIANKDLKDIDSPKIFEKSEVMQWFYNLAYTQWSIEEFEKGLPLKHLGFKPIGSKTSGKKFKILKYAKDERKKFCNASVIFSNKSGSKLKTDKFLGQKKGFEKLSFLASEGRKWKSDFFCKPWELHEYLGEKSVSKFFIDDSIRDYGLEAIIYTLIPGLKLSLTRGAEVNMIFRDSEFLMKKHLLNIEKMSRNLVNEASLKKKADYCIYGLRELNIDMSIVGKSIYPNLIYPSGHKTLPISPTASVSHKLIIPIFQLHNFVVTNRIIEDENVYLQFINNN